MKRFLLIFALAFSLRASCIPPPNTWDSDAQIWQSAVGTNGGTLSATAYLAGTYFSKQLRWWGLRPLTVRRAGVYLGTTTNAMLVPIFKDTDGDAIDDLIAFAAGDYSESAGLTGNGTTKYLRCGRGTGVSLGSFANFTNIHMALYFRTNSAEATTSMGVTDGVNGIYGVAARNANFTYTFMGLNFNNVSDTNGLGFYCITRTTSTLANAYTNGVPILTNTVAEVGPISGGAVVVHAFNSAGAINNFTTRTICYYAMGQGIPASQARPYYLAVHNLQAALGRNTE